MEQSRINRIQCQVEHGGWRIKVRVLLRGIRTGSVGYHQGRRVTVEEEDVGASQKIRNPTQAKEKFKGHFLFQISNMRVFQMREIKL